MNVGERKSNKSRSVYFMINREKIIEKIGNKLDRRNSNIVAMYIIIFIFISISTLFGTLLDVILRTGMLFTTTFGMFSVMQVLFGLSVIDKMILRVIGAVPLDNKNEKSLLETAQAYLNEVKQAINLDFDIQLATIETHSINALSVGRREHTHTIGITTGALEKLEVNEIKSLLLHELYHIVNKDVDYLTTVSGTFGSPLLIFKLSKDRIRKFLKSKKKGLLKKEEQKKQLNGIILSWFIMIISSLFIPLSFLSNIFISVRKEFKADSFAATMISKDAVISLLKKTKENCLSLDTEYIFIRYHFFVHPNCADIKKKTNSILSTYPSIEERISYIENIDNKI